MGSTPTQSPLQPPAAAAPESAARELGGFAEGLRIDQPPRPVVDEAVRALTNVVGYTIGGARHLSVGMALAAMLPFARPTAGIISRSHRAY